MKIKIDGGIVRYNDDKLTRDIVFRRIVDFFLKTGCFNGECCLQNDICQLEAPELLAGLADDILQFEVKDDVLEE